MRIKVLGKVADIVHKGKTTIVTFDAFQDSKAWVSIGNCSKLVKYNKLKCWYKDIAKYNKNLPLSEYIFGHGLFVKSQNSGNFIQCGVIHRDDGPAIEIDGADDMYYINGKNVSYEEWFLKQII